MAARPVNRRRRSRAPADFVLEVAANSRLARRRRREALALWALRLALLAALGALAYYGGRWLFDRFFFSNQEYTVRTLEFDLGGVMTREEAMERTGLREGINIFSVDLAEVESVLASESMAARVRIERLLPSTLRVAIEPRRPVAWIEKPCEAEPPVEKLPSNGFLADATGFLMKPRRLSAEHLALPSISGLPDDLLGDGRRPENEALRAALELLSEWARRPHALFRPRRLDVSRGWRIEAEDASGAVFIFGLEDMGGQLDRLEQLLAHCHEAGRQIQSANLMVRRNMPVTFVMADSLPEPVAKGGKR